jgi:uncharacterized protein YjbI with pentapeptide repeats
MDWGKPNFLNNFYDKLLEYIAHSIGKDNIIKSYNTNVENKILIDAEELIALNDSNYLIELKDYFNQENTSFDILLMNKLIVFNNIFFPEYDGRDNFDYSKILSKLKKIHFNYCKFSTTYLELNDKKVFFQDCEFFYMYSISNSEILQNQSNIIYQMCVFNDDVYISKGDNKSNIIKHTLFRDCQFKKNISAQNMEFKDGVFNNSKYNKYTNIYNLELYNCIVTSDFILLTYSIHILNLSETTFKGKVKIQFCKLLSKATFNNTKFNNLADFYQTKFSDVDFGRTDFNQIAVFSESVFKKDIYFQYTKFLKKSIFRDMIVKGKLDLRNTIFDDEANFLDIRADTDINTPIKVENRETARVIKNFYENSNNVIEANKFYTLEMQEREKELNKDIKQGRNLFEWITFKIHSISSNHSQDWLLALSWIIIFGFISSLVSFYSIQDNNSTYIHFTLNSGIKLILLSGIVLWLKFVIQDKIFTINKLSMILMYFVYYLITKDVFLSMFSQTLNPFSMMQENDNINIFQLICKIIIAYLIYQLITSIRQNTRRK